MDAQSSAKQLVAEAGQAMQRGDMATALTLLSNAEAGDPGNANALRGFGVYGGA